MHDFILLRPLLLATALSLTACGDSSSTSQTSTLTPTTSSGNRLSRAVSTQTLEAHIRAALLTQYGTVQQWPVYVTTGTELQAPTAAPDSSSTTIRTSSTTNTQEAGVDEADRIKSDGGYLYASASETPALLIFKTEGATNRQLATLPVKTANGSPLSGLYKNGNQLIGLASNYEAYAYAASRILPPYKSKPASTQLFMLDITQPEQPKQTLELAIEGEPISSRMVGSTLYIATRHTPTLSGLTPYPSTETEAAANRNLINQATLADFLPNYSINQQDQGELFTASDCFLTPYSATHQSATIISLLAIDTQSAAPVPQGECFSGDTETLYASTQAIYLATTRYNYETDDNGWAIYSGSVNTDLHKFALTNNAVSYRGSGQVNGHLGWYQDLKPFRLSEHENTLRVITYTGDTPTATTSTAHLYNLRENSATGNLDMIGQLPNANRPAAIGKPGEQIYAARMQGNRGYLVTFRATDPLYVLDLSNPADPFIAGELQMDGYSDYLHPVGENFLLGVGKDAIPDTTSPINITTSTADSLMALPPSSENARGAWYQGVKLSLIDVTNPQQPVEKQKIILGKRGSETTVSQTHHALTTLLKGTRMQVALPLSRNDRISTDNPYTNTPSFYYSWTQDELVKLDIDTVNGIMTQRPSLVGSTSSSTNNYSSQWPDDRSVMIDDNLHYLHGDKVISGSW